MNTLAERLTRIMRGDVAIDPDTLNKYSRDTSIFSKTPAVVVFPKDADDVASVVRYAHEARGRGERVSVTARSAGTDMTGGPLTDSISLVLTKYMNRILHLDQGAVTAEPGMYYRDLERETLKKTGKLFPAYPASRELCAFGGIIANNSGGELTLRYGKTEKYVRGMHVVLSDGSRAHIRPLNPEELANKEREDTLEGRIYRGVHRLVDEHAATIEAARPSVTKNSAGYSLWNVMDREKKTFDLGQLIVGSQGTLAVVTDATVELVKLKTHRAMLVVFLSDLSILPTIVHRVLDLEPESFESYDDQTFRLAVRFAPQIIRHFGFVQMIKLAFAFLPEAWLVFTGGVPKLVLMAEFAEDTADEAMEKARQARASLAGLHVRTKIARSETQSAKYWTIRRESFALLRKNLKGLYAAPFIDDLVVHPDDYPRFLPELDALLANHRFIYTIAGHIGDGNFHIIPLENMADAASRDEILDLMPKVFALVAKYKGSITGEHNDGIIRTPYLPLMYGNEVCALFDEVKHIFDPLGVLNPGKKTGGTIEDIRAHMITRV